MYKMLITGMKKIYSSKHLLCCGSSAYSLWGSRKTWTCSSKGLQELWESEWTLLSIHVLQMGGAPALTIADSFFCISTLMPWVTEKHSCQKHLYHPLLCLYCHLCRSSDKISIAWGFLFCDFWPPKIIMMLPRNHLSLLLTNPPLTTGYSVGYLNPQQP